MMGDVWASSQNDLEAGNTPDGRSIRHWSSKREGVDFKLLTENSNDVIFKIGSDGFSHYVSPSSTRVLKLVSGGNDWERF